MTKWTENVTSSLGYDFVNRSTLTNITPKSSLLARRTNISTEGPEKVAKAVVEILTFNAKHYQDTKKQKQKEELGRSTNQATDCLDTRPIRRAGRDTGLCESLCNIRGACSVARDRMVSLLTAACYRLGAAVRTCVI